MGKFKNTRTGAVVSVDDSKDRRFGDGWEPSGKPTEKPKASSKPDSKK